MIILSVQKDNYHELENISQKIHNATVNNSLNRLIKMYFFK
jgi:hypothetical protein